MQLYEGTKRVSKISGISWATFDKVWRLFQRNIRSHCSFTPEKMQPRAITFVMFAINSRVEEGTIAHSLRT